MSTVTTSPTPTATHPGMAGLVASTDFAGAFAALRDARQGVEPEWLGTARGAAFARVEASGLPTRKGESWRYTNLAAFAKQSLSSAPSRATLGNDERTALEAALDARALDGTVARLVFVDGTFDAQASTIAGGAGVSVLRLDEVLADSTDDVAHLVASTPEGEGRAFHELNTALFHDAVVVRVDAGQAPDGPIQLLYASTGIESIAFPRTLVTVGPNAHATVVEESFSLSAGASALAPVTQVRLGAGAVLRTVRVQGLADDANEFASTEVTLDRDARWTGATVQVGGAISRDEVRVEYAGPGGDCEYAALSVTDGKRTADVQAQVRHTALHCKSRQTYRGIVDDKARGVFNTRVAVERGADGSDTGQSSKSLLLSDGAIAHTKPQLEVLADDVKCFHGATVGQLDADALFFLRARGIAADEARALLTLAFAGEVLQALPLADLRARLEDEVRERTTPGATQGAGS